MAMGKKVQKTEFMVVAAVLLPNILKQFGIDVSNQEIQQTQEVLDANNLSYYLAAAYVVGRSIVKAVGEFTKAREPKDENS